MKFLPFSRRAPFALAGLLALQGASFAQQTVAPTPLEPTPLDPSASVPGAALPLPTPRISGNMTDEQVRALGQGPAFPTGILERVMERVITKDGSIVISQLNREPDLKLFERAVALADTNQFPVFQDKDESGSVVQNRNSELAFYINVYNGLFLKALGDAYPVKSVTQIKDLDSAKRVVGGQSLSFAEMRRKIAALDRRALFALIDGTTQGPRAPQAPFRFANLGRQLNASVKAFVDDLNRVSIPERGSNGQVFVSPWLQSVDEYFRTKVAKRKGDGIKTILSAYISNGANRRYFGAGDYQIKYLPTNPTIAAAPPSASLARPVASSTAPPVPLTN
jgi:hypothetical protein